MNPYEPPQSSLEPGPVKSPPTIPAPDGISAWAVAVILVLIFLATLPALFLALRTLHALGVDMGAETNVLDELIPYAILIVSGAVVIIYLLLKTQRRNS